MTMPAAEAVPIEPNAPAAGAWPSPARAWYAVFVFALALLVNFLDRGIVPLLVPSIKADLHLSDFQMSLVMGFAFIMFYVFLGLPVARLADVGTRRTIVGVGIALWSGATALCGLAANFWQLFVCRIFTGVGESCGGPATYSMLADLFPPQKLPRAIAVFSLGFMWGTGFALIVGGAVIGFLQTVPPIDVPLLGVLKSWQTAFLLVGMPGLLVAALLFTVKEPVRRGRLMQGKRAKAMPLREVGKFLWDNRSVYGPMMLGLAFNTVYAIGNLSWAPAFYGRTYGWSMMQVGVYMGLTLLVVWPLGAMFGSWLAERWTKQGKDDANLRVVVCAIACVVPLSIAFPLMPSPELALAVNAVNGFFAAWVLGPQNAAIQVVTPNEMRGLVSATAIFIINVLGYGLGPTFVATISQYVYGGEAELRYAMSTAAAVMGPLAAFSIWWGLKAYGNAVAKARESWG